MSVGTCMCLHTLLFAYVILLVRVYVFPSPRTSSTFVDTFPFKASCELSISTMSSFCCLSCIVSCGPGFGGVRAACGRGRRRAAPSHDHARDLNQREAGRAHRRGSCPRLVHARFRARRRFGRVASCPHTLDDRGQHVEAFALLKVAACRGVAMAHFQLGAAWEQGSGVPALPPSAAAAAAAAAPDVPCALACYSVAACAAGLATAQTQCGPTAQCGGGGVVPRGRGAGATWAACAARRERVLARPPGQR